MSDSDNKDTAQSRISDTSLVADLIPDIIAEVNTEKVYTWLNKAGVNFFGEDAIGKNASEYFIGEQNTYDKVQPLFEGSDEVIYVESWQKRKDGEKRLLGWLCKAIKDESGKVLGALSTGHDITKRFEIEEKIRNSEAQLHNAMALAHLGPWEYDVAEDKFTFNDTFYALFHTNIKDVGTYFLTSREYANKFVFPDDIPLVGDEVKKAIESTDSNYAREIEHRIKYADGGVGYIVVRFFTTKDASGKTIKTYGINQDITQRKLLEEKNNRSQVLLQNIIDLLPVRIFWKDKDLKYLGCNRVFAKDAGKNNPEELIGKNDFDMGWKQQADSYRKDDRAVIESRVPKENYVEEQTTPTGEKIWLTTSKIPLLSESNEIIGVLGTYLDITSQKKSEDRLKRALEDTKKMNDLMIDRELKMMELKKEISNLKSQNSS